MLARVSIWLSFSVGVDSVSASEGEKKEVIAEEASVGKDLEAVDMEVASAEKDSEAASVAKDSEATDITIITTTTEVLEASDTEADSKDKIKSVIIWNVASLIWYQYY